MKTISIINLKGGVAKTISSVNIAHILAAIHKKRVLLIDNDKQGNASKMFGLHSYDCKTIADVMTEKDIDIKVVIKRTSYENLDLLPANMNLLKANMDVLLDVSRPQQIRLKKALEQVAGDYDYCIIDNAPDINMSVINALVVSDDVLVPVKIDKHAFDGIEQINEQMMDIWDFNPGVSFRCFITMFQKNNVNRQGYEWLKEQSEYHAFDTVIHKTVKVDESTFEEKPLLGYAKRCTAAKDYVALVEEYLASEE